MKVAGFTFIRNAITYDYPIIEAIQSILPLCDELVVAVGQSEDTTLDLIKNIGDPKIRIIQTVWNDDLREGGQVLALETDKAFKAISEEADWAFYIQGDEVLDDKNHVVIKKALQDFKDDEKVDGLLFNYRHFYGSYDYVADARGWYRREIRVIKNKANIYSYRDAQGFRKGNNEKLNVKLVDAYIHHYGWVKDPRAMQRKQEQFNKYWHDDEWVNQNILKADAFDYSGIRSLQLFNEEHPKVMEKRIREKNWQFDHDISHNQYTFKDRMSRFVEKITGRRIWEYKNYRIV